MKFKILKKMVILFVVIMGLVLTAYSSFAFEETISLNSPTTFPVDI